MVTQFTFKITDEPGLLAKIAEALGGSGINIDGISGFSSDSIGIINIVTSDSEAAEEALNKAKIQFIKQPVFKIHLTDKPGQLARLTRALAVEGINITSFYISMDSHQVIGVDDFDHANHVAKSLGIVD